MSVLLTGAGLFLASFLLQILIWRIRLPRRQTRAIFIIFLMVLAAFAAFQILIHGEQSRFELSPFESLYVIFVYISVLPAYIILYTMIEGESPSSLMLLALRASGSRGVTQKDFEAIITDEVLIWPRVRALEAGRHIILRDGRYLITPGGVRYMHTFMAPRYIMGHHQHGG